MQIFSVLKKNSLLLGALLLLLGSSASAQTRINLTKLAKPHTAAATLITDGSGNVVWSTTPLSFSSPNLSFAGGNSVDISGINYWTASGANIYRNGGTVAIGATSSTQKFSVTGATGGANIAAIGSSLADNDALFYGTGSKVGGAYFAFDFNTACTGGNVIGRIQNTNNTSTVSNALFQLQTNVAGGDAFIQLQTVGSGGAVWAAGIDNSDGDAYSIAPSSLPGVSGAFKLATTRQAFFPAYGLSTFTGTPATVACFTNTGGLIERTLAELLADLGGGGGSPSDALYLTLASHASLSNERVFTPGNNLKNTDAGANSTLTLDADTEDVSWTGDFSPAQFGTNQNNWNPAGLSTASSVNISLSASCSITGIAGGTDGRFIILHNLDATDILTLPVNNGNSLTANQFKWSADLNLDPGESAFLQYSIAKGGWTLVGHSGLIDGTKVTTFFASGTWTKTTGAKSVEVICIGGGGGGGAGCKGAAGTQRNGGAGGAGGGLSRHIFLASDLGATETITIGTGGAGAAAQTVNTTNGANGTTGGNTSFGAHIRATGGVGGAGGTTTSNVGGIGGFGALCNGGDGANANGSGNAGSSPANARFAPAGGGSGGGLNTSNTERNGGNGGTVDCYGGTLLGGAGAATSASAGAPGNSADGAKFGSGGGGGSSETTGNGSAGGAGANYGAGGGGGGAATNSLGNSGAGGAGAAGIVIIIENF